MKAFEIGGHSIAPGTSEKVDLEVSTLANAARLSLPVSVVHGASAGPTFFMSGTIHGDEIQGVEIIRRVLGSIKPAELSGTILAVPIVNSFGFLNHSRYMPDRRDLNRSFPGSDRGSLASLLADLFFSEVVKRSQFGIDFHTAALHRSNLAQIRLTAGDAALAAMAQAFAPPVILTSKHREASLRKSAHEAGVKVILFEGGEALRFEEASIKMAVSGTQRLLKHLKMIKHAPDADAKTTTAHSSSSFWLRAPEGGILHSRRQDGDLLAIGDEIGVITGPMGENPELLLAQESGLIIGRTNLPIVNRGDALFHIARLDGKGTADQSVPDEDEII